MTNNDILKKLRIALKLRDEDIIEILKLVDFRFPRVNSVHSFVLKTTRTTRNAETNCSGIS